MCGINVTEAPLETKKKIKNYVIEHQKANDERVKKSGLDIDDIDIDRDVRWQDAEDMMWSGFLWAKTPEGHAYWSELTYKINHY